MEDTVPESPSHEDVFEVSDATPKKKVRSKLTVGRRHPVGHEEHKRKVAAGEISPDGPYEDSSLIRHRNDISGLNENDDYSKADLIRIKAERLEEKRKEEQRWANYSPRKRHNMSGFKRGLEDINREMEGPDSTIASPSLVGDAQPQFNDSQPRIGDAQPAQLLAPGEFKTPFAPAYNKISTPSHDQLLPDLQGDVSVIPGDKNRYRFRPSDMHVLQNSPDAQHNEDNAQAAPKEATEKIEDEKKENEAEAAPTEDAPVETVPSVDNDAPTESEIAEANDVATPEPVIHVPAKIDADDDAIEDKPILFEASILEQHGNEPTERQRSSAVPNGDLGVSFGAEPVVVHPASPPVKQSVAVEQVEEVVKPESPQNATCASADQSADKPQPTNLTEGHCDDTKDKNLTALVHADKDKSAVAGRDNASEPDASAAADTQPTTPVAHKSHYVSPETPLSQVRPMVVVDTPPVKSGYVDRHVQRTFRFDEEDPDWSYNDERDQMKSYADATAEQAEHQQSEHDLNVTNKQEHTNTGSPTTPASSGKASSAIGESAADVVADAEADSSLDVSAGHTCQLNVSGPIDEHTFEQGQKSYKRVWVDHSTDMSTGGDETPAAAVKKRRKSVVFSPQVDLKIISPAESTNSGNVSLVGNESGFSEPRRSYGDVTNSSDSMKYRSTLLGPALVVPDPSGFTPDLRRSKRTKIPRLHTELGQHPVYEWSQGGGAEVIGINPVKIKDKDAKRYGVADAQAIFRARQRHEKMKPKHKIYKTARRGKRGKEPWQEEVLTRRFEDIPDGNGGVIQAQIACPPNFAEVVDLEGNAVQSPLTHDYYKEEHFNGAQLCGGFLVINPSCKYAVDGHSFDMLFVVSEGVVRCQIESNTPWVVEQGYSLKVPSGVAYSLENVLEDREAKLWYTYNKPQKMKSVEQSD